MVPCVISGGGQCRFAGVEERRQREQNDDRSENEADFDDADFRFHGILRDGLPPLADILAPTAPCRCPRARSDGHIGNLIARLPVPGLCRSCALAAKIGGESRETLRIFTNEFVTRGPYPRHDL